MAVLVMMCGIPGSGKSTMAEQYATMNSLKVVSRDEIRLSLTGEDEDYFANETAVFKQFVAKIVEHLKNGTDVVADATHLTVKSRQKLLNAVGKEVDLNTIMKCVLYVNTDLNTSLQRNNLRAGTRAFVPVAAIRRMSNQFEVPQITEDNIDVIMKGIANA